MIFNTGDKVSFINEKLSGVVIRRLDKDQVLVRLDDGFEIPANAGELVLAERAERKAENVHIAAEAPEAGEEQFLGLAFVIEGSKLARPDVKAFLINTTPFSVLFTAYNTTGDKNMALYKGQLETAEAIQIASFALDKAEQWRNWQLQVLRFGVQGADIPLPWLINYKLKEAGLLKTREKLPVTGKEGMLIKLDDLAMESAEAGGFRAPAKAGKKQEPGVEPVSEVVDLHMETDQEIMNSLQAESILSLQMLQFRNALDKAVAFRMPKITFIHGIGNGRLKNKLHQALKKEAEVRSFEEADPKKFGYGATTVYLKSY